MNEGKKTLIYAGLALAIGLIAYATTPSPVGFKPSDAVGKPLFESFTDPLAAKSLEIVSFDAANSKLTSFKVTQNKDGSWSIPSHGDYPADAENQLRDVATALVDLRPLDVVSEVADDHEYFGVIAPDKDKTKTGEQGVGLLVRMQDENGKPLAQLVIGKTDRKSEEQRFVRIPSQDVTYVAKIDTKKFSTNFGDWIQKDLLQLNAFDVERLKLMDYSVNRTERGLRLDARLEATMAFDAPVNQWKLEDMITYVQRKPTKTLLSESEELNREKIDAMKTALDDLQIVDVQRKPKGLTSDLKADAGFMSDQESVDSLIQRGFIPSQRGENGPVELFSANGEVHVGTKDGVEYVLRFGNFASVDEGSSEGKLNRYLFVHARFDESKFPEPTYEPEPALVPDAAPAKPAAKPVEGGAGGGNGGADDGDAKPAAEKPADEKPAAEKPAEEKPAEGKPTPGADAKPETKPETKPESKKDPAVERERIRKENQRRKDEWQDKVKKGKARVETLNARFADWYYVISEDTYKKIHLGRADIIRERTGPSDEGVGVDAFRKLQKEGLRKTPPAPAGGPPPGFPGLPPQ
ncbi:MAG: DUF4340 domain-containing protein [Pirellulales bacterium]